MQFLTTVNVTALNIIIIVIIAELQNIIIVIIVVVIIIIIAELQKVQTQIYPQNIARIANAVQCRN